MTKIGISAVQINGDNHSKEEIEKSATGKYQMIYTSPEFLTPGGPAYKLFDSAAFRQRLFCLVIDEAHLVQDWYTFPRSILLYIG